MIAKSIARIRCILSEFIAAVYSDAASAAFQKILREKASWLDTLAAQEKNIKLSSAAHALVLMINAGDLNSGKALLRTLAGENARRKKKPTPKSRILSLEFCEAAAAVHRGNILSVAGDLIESAEEPEVCWNSFAGKQDKALEKTPDQTFQDTWQISQRFTAKACGVHGIRSAEDTAASKLAYCQLTNRNPTTLQQLPAGEEQLQHTVDLLVCHGVDCGLMNDGLLASARYVQSALAANRCVTIPLAIRLVGVLAETHKKMRIQLNDEGQSDQFISLNVSTWNRVLVGPEKFLQQQQQGSGSNVIPYSAFHSDRCKPLSRPFVLCEFPNLARMSRAPKLRHNEVVVPVTTDGEADCVLFWYEFLLISPDEKSSATMVHGVTNCPPHFLEKDDCSESGVAYVYRSGIQSDSAENFRTARFYCAPTTDGQAMQFLSQPALVLAADKIHLAVDCTDTSLHIDWAREKMPDFSIRCTNSVNALLQDKQALTYWAGAERKLFEISNGLSNVIADPATAKKVCAAAIDIAAYPYQDKSAVFDVEDALWFALSFFT